MSVSWIVICLKITTQRFYLFLTTVYTLLPLIIIGSLFQTVTSVAVIQDSVSAWNWLYRERFPFYDHIAYAVLTSVVCGILFSLVPRLASSLKGTSITLFLVLSTIDALIFRSAMPVLTGILFNALGGCLFGLCVTRFYVVTKSLSVRERLGHRVLQQFIGRSSLILVTMVSFVIYVVYFIYPFPAELSTTLKASSLYGNSVMGPHDGRSIFSNSYVSLEVRGAYLEFGGQDVMWKLRRVAFNFPNADVQLREFRASKPFVFGSQFEVQGSDQLRDFAHLSGLILDGTVKTEKQPELDVDGSPIGGRIDLRQSLVTNKESMFSFSDLYGGGSIYLSSLGTGLSISTHSRVDGGFLLRAPLKSGLIQVWPQRGMVKEELWFVKVWTEAAGSVQELVRRRRLSVDKLNEAVDGWSGLSKGAPKTSLRVDESDLDSVQAYVTERKFNEALRKTLPQDRGLELKFQNSSSSEGSPSIGIYTSSIECDDCSLAGGSIWTNEMTMSAAEDASIRLSLEKYEVGVGDAVFIQSNQLEVMNLLPGNKVSVHWPSAFVKVGNKYLNKTLWKRTPTEWFFPGIAFLIGALGFQHSHLREFVQRVFKGARE